MSSSITWLGGPWGTQSPWGGLAHPGSTGRLPCQMLSGIPKLRRKHVVIVKILLQQAENLSQHTCCMQFLLKPFILHILEVFGQDHVSH